MKLLLFASYLLFYFLLHSILANNKIKLFLTKRYISKKYYRLMFNFLAIVLLIPIFSLYFQIESKLLFESYLLKIVGGLFSIIGLFLAFYALIQYDLSEFAGTRQLKGEIPKGIIKLKTTGINSLVRHPLYFANLLLVWGFFMYHSTVLVLLMASIISLYLYFGTKKEEEKLIEEFGEAYLDYKKRVPMLLPFFNF